MADPLLAHIARYVALSPSEQARVANAVQRRAYRKRQYLLQAGDVCFQEYFVLKGALRCYRVDNEGREHVLQFGFENWWVGDLSSFLTGRPSQLHIDALEDSEVLLLSTADRQRLMDEVPALERYFRLLMEGAFVAAQRRILSGMVGSARDQYVQLVELYPQLEQRVAQQHIASYLGITPESLSRLRRQLAQGEG